MRNLKSEILKRSYRITLHAERERFYDKIDIEGIETVLLSGEIIEDYPNDKRGHSCLILGFYKGRPIHIVSGGIDNLDEEIVIITVYRPNKEEWKLDWKTRRR